MIYAHRNGETTPPEQEGYYWFCGEFPSDRPKDRPIPMLPKERQMFVLENDRGEMSVYYGFGGWISVLGKFNGRWWGPIPKPEEMP